MNPYHWYPGHMTKAIRMMKENLTLVDMIRIWLLLGRTSFGFFC